MKLHEIVADAADIIVYTSNMGINTQADSSKALIAEKYILSKKAMNVLAEKFERLKKDNKKEDADDLYCDVIGAIN
ncbi:hypothetical protein IWW36_005281, partial [Coemansia brasiliensis]